MFLQSEVWVKFPFWRGAVRTEVFGEVCGEVFGEVSGLVLLAHSEQTNFKIPTTLHSNTGLSGVIRANRFARIG